MSQGQRATAYLCKLLCEELHLNTAYSQEDNQTMLLVRYAG